MASMAEKSGSLKDGLSDFGQMTENVRRKWREKILEEHRVEFDEDMRTLAVVHDQKMDTVSHRTTQTYLAASKDDVIDDIVRRRAFMAHLRQQVNDGVRLGLNAIGVIFLDINDFKNLNDQHGHDIGDQTLVAVSKIFRSTIRVGRGDEVVHLESLDKGIARAGGDEFVASVVLDDKEQIELILQRLYKRLHDPAVQLSAGYKIDRPLTVAIGAVGYDLVSGLASAEVLVKIADQQMYLSKKDGKAHFTLIPPGDIDT